LIIYYTLCIEIKILRINVKYFVNNQKRKIGGEFVKLKITILLTAMIMVVLTNVNDRVSWGAEKWDATDSVLQETQGKVVLCEIKTSFDLANNKDSDRCLELLNELEFTKGKGASINIMKDEVNYCVEFQNENISGYIESTSYNNHNTITIDIQKKCENNQLENINEAINFSINKVYNSSLMEISNKQTFKFIKAEVPGTDIHEVNNKVAKLLKKHNSVNVNTIDINNGFSTVAYTGRNEYIQNQGKKIDFNYAICKYSSGNYVVIGIPIITASY
jgi:uncharacterized FlaG/YvyC family protein